MNPEDITQGKGTTRVPEGLAIVEAPLPATRGRPNLDVVPNIEVGWMAHPLPFPRLLGIWALMAVAMSANGIFRELALKRLVSPAIADVMNAALGIAIILLITRWLLRPLAGRSIAQLAIASLLLVGLTVVFEFAMGRYVDHKRWAELRENYALWRGRLWPLVLLTLALTPFLWGRKIAR